MRSQAVRAPAGIDTARRSRQPHDAELRAFVPGVAQRVLRVELGEGRFAGSAAPAVAHQRIADRLCRLLDDAVADGGVEAVTAVGVRIAPGLGHIPDVVVCTELVETAVVEVELVALAVEVVSPSTTRRDRLEKPAVTFDPADLVGSRRPGS